MLFIYFNFNIIVLVKENSNKIILIKRYLAIIFDACFCLRCVLEYNLSLFVKYNAKVLTTKLDILFAQKNIENL